MQESEGRIQARDWLEEEGLSFVELVGELWGSQPPVKTADINDAGRAWIYEPKGIELSTRYKYIRADWLRTLCHELAHIYAPMQFQRGFRRRWLHGPAWANEARALVDFADRCSLWDSDEQHDLALQSFRSNHRGYGGHLEEQAKKEGE